MKKIVILMSALVFLAAYSNVFAADTIKVEGTIQGLLAMHRYGYWGDLCQDDKESNDEAVKHGGRILSSYLVGIKKVWVITEADRSVTTILLPSEY